MIIEVQNSSFPSEVPTAGSSFITVENDQLKTKHSDGSIKVYSTGITSEEVRDIVGVMVTDTTTIDLTYDDVNDQITAQVKDNSITNSMLTSGIDSSKIGTGVVNNTEFSYLDGVTSSIQTQFTSKENIGVAASLDASHIAAIDPHTQYLKKASNLSELSSVSTARTNLGLGDSATKNVGTSSGTVSSGDHTHSGIYEPANSNIQSHISSTSNPHSTNAAQVGADPIGTAVATVNTHVASSDPHTQYHNDARGDVRYYTKTESNAIYSPIIHSHNEATQSEAGYLSASDKTKLDNITNPTLLKTTATLSSTSNTTFTNLTELSQSCVSGKTYRFEIWLVYSSAATSTGIVMSMACPTGTLVANATALVAANGTASAYHGYISGSGVAVTSSGTPTTTAYHMCKIEGLFICSTAGNLYPQFRSEVSGSQVTVVGGSLALYNAV